MEILGTNPKAHTLQKPSSRVMRDSSRGHQELIKHTLQKPRASRSRFSGLRSR